MSFLFIKTVWLRVYANSQPNCLAYNLSCKKYLLVLQSPINCTSQIIDVFIVLAQNLAIIIRQLANRLSITLDHLVEDRLVVEYVFLLVLLADAHWVDNFNSVPIQDVFNKIELVKIEVFVPGHRAGQEYAKLIVFHN